MESLESGERTGGQAGTEFDKFQTTGVIARIGRPGKTGVGWRRHNGDASMRPDHFSAGVPKPFTRGHPAVVWHAKVRIAMLSLALFMSLC
jgi:hypothetical protein